jgi:hypothetical protein
MTLEWILIVPELALWIGLVTSIINLVISVDFDRRNSWHTRITVLIYLFQAVITSIGLVVTYLVS